MNDRLLLTTTTTPAARILDWAATDQMAYRLTRGQGPFCLYQHTHASGLHLLAQNVSCPSTVLENPSLDDFAAELSTDFEYVGIGYDPLNTERMLAMCDLVRRRSPRSRILLGGHGVICLPRLDSESCIAEQVHGVCQTEGVGFLRALLGDPLDQPIRGLLPKEGASLPWLSPRSVGTNGVILSGLGCSQRCPFCATSAFTNGRYLEVMDAGQIFESMRAYWAHSPFTASVSIYDENFLDQHDKVVELGRRIRGDCAYGLARLNYSAFGSVSALARYDPEELLLAGLDKVWCGIESKFSDLGKRQGTEPADVFARLHAVGIKTIGSWIIGQDFQTPANIQEDMNYFLDLDATFQQLSILGVVPGTPLWQRYEAEGRIPGRVPWDEYHLYGQTFIHDHFSHQQMAGHLDDLYDRIYHVNGPALMKALEVNLNGYEACLVSTKPALRKQKAQFFADQCRSYHPLVKTALAFAPSEAVKARIEEIDLRFREHFGMPPKHEQKLADQIAERAQWAYPEHQRRARPQDEPLRRYTYPARAARPEGRAYRVEYPNAQALDRLVRASPPALSTAETFMDP